MATISPSLRVWAFADAVQSAETATIAKSDLNIANLL
jgi:hypothetical protein